MTPFKIFGHTYFAGTYQACCHLIDTGAGLIMMDPGYKSTAYLVIDSIYKLGFKPEDIMYIIKTIIGEDDACNTAQYFTPDITVRDGDTLTLGNITVTFLHTPGHTKGTISPFYTDTDGKNTYRIGMFGGAGLNTMAPDEFDFDGCREAYFASLERLKREKVDIFIGNHIWNNATYEKYVKMSGTGKNEFIDCNLCALFLNTKKEELEALIAKE